MVKLHHIFDANNIAEFISLGQYTTGGGAKSAFDYLESVIDTLATIAENHRPDLRAMTHHFQAPVEMMGAHTAGDWTFLSEAQHLIGDTLHNLTSAGPLFELYITPLRGRIECVLSHYQNVKVRITCCPLRCALLPSVDTLFSTTHHACVLCSSAAPTVAVHNMDIDKRTHLPDRLSSSQVPVRQTPYDKARAA